MIIFNTRLGIGVDIEHSEDIIHMMQTLDGEVGLVAFAGLLIKIPFLTIYIGDFAELESD